VLQGGGAHGAFTWGVLEGLLEEPRPRIEGISGSSAGAINATKSFMKSCDAFSGKATGWQAILCFARAMMR
jgi:predicted patatin/cPLA2 family phospholipase